LIAKGEDGGYKTPAETLTPCGETSSELWLTAGPTSLGDFQRFRAWVMITPDARFSVIRRMLYSSYVVIVTKEDSNPRGDRSLLSLRLWLTNLERRNPRAGTFRTPASLPQVRSSHSHPSPSVSMALRQSN
jgi:hypothetical protein